MKKIACISATAILASACGQKQASYENVQLQSFDTLVQEGEEGYEKGVSACFAGGFENYLLIAGGCNFPNVPVAEGGKKKFYKGIYIAKLNEENVKALKLKKIGDLPQETAYGVSVATPKGLVCMGGTSSQGPLKAVYRLSLVEIDNKLSCEIIDLAPLPFNLDNMAVSAVGNKVYIAGGNCDGKPSNKLIFMDLDAENPQWTILPDFPEEPRVQPVSSALEVEGKLRIYIFGGCAGSHDGIEATLCTDGLYFDVESQTWHKVAAPVDANGEEVSLGGGVAQTFDNQYIVACGGVHKDVFLSALRSLPEGYLLKPVEWYQFNDRLLVFDARAEKWRQVAENKELARAGAVLVSNGKGFYNINGELKPGIRSPKITKIIFK